ncbi:MULTISPECIES: HlyD family efflux transporter periplasmic adaptor subunit [Leptolyngbya]|uniref:HlyD family efflux transporter periplasmic adaptor subunit n=1 Tax=Leptolyngbya TaxID=47251 RepID=UPI001683DB92|nr:HlyD family efflux transporter periplasmic adaptor subunit [Leptolyngbya sp. FACHB-1624]MBD1855322.1 HlyD family efflux transporter periplasmic adaptor subunit [Leptolyngbya sp. FACHB-1624]
MVSIQSSFLNRKPSETQSLPSVDSHDFLPKLNRWISLSGILLAGSVAVTVAIASVSRYNVTVKAPATVRPSGELRVVQPEIEGTIKSIEVRENQTVRRGDVIARLDAEQLRIKKNQLENNLQQGKLQLIQLDAQLQTLQTQVLAESRVVDRTVDTAQLDLERNQRDHQERQQTTQAEQLAATASLQKAEADLQKAKMDLSFAQREEDRYRTLMQAGGLSQQDFDKKLLATKQAESIVATETKSVEIASAKQQQAIAALNPSQAPVAIAQKRIAQEQAKGESTLATLAKEKQGLIQKRSELSAQLSQFQQEQQQLDRQIEQATIRATSDGTILKLDLRNPGQVVRPGDAISQIAPNDTPLIIKANLSPQDIQTVAIGQRVQLRVDACPYPDFGTLEGTVKTISPDAIADSKEKGSYFDVTIEPKTLSLNRRSRQCSIQPGMEAKADIIAKEETVLQFVLRKARLIADL